MREVVFLVAIAAAIAAGIIWYKHGNGSVVCPECGYLMDAAEQDPGSNEVRYFCQRCGGWVTE